MKERKTPPRLLTQSAVCTMLSCSAQTVRRLRKQGLDTKGREGIYLVVYLTNASRLLRILIDPVNRFLANRTTSCLA